MAEAVDTAAPSFQIDRNGDQPPVVLRRSLCYQETAGMTGAICRLADETARCVPVDMRSVRDVEAEMLESLICSASAVKTQGRRLRLSNVSPSVISLLDRLQLTHVFCLQPKCRRGHPDHHCPFASKSWEASVFELPSDLRSCREARDRVARLADLAGFAAEDRDDVLLAVGETTSNAIKHGKSNGGDGRFTVSCVATREQMFVSVSDKGPGFDPADIPDHADGELLEKGRGIHCTNAVMDEVEFYFEGGTTVRMVKRAAR